MNIEILAISKLKDPSLKIICEKYVKRIKNYCPVELKEINSKSKPPTTSKLVLLDENGLNFKSQEFAKWIETNRDNGLANITFVIGEDKGFPKQFLEKQPILLSLSKLTLQHDLARLIFLEQLYRAFTIIKNHPYHRD